MITVLPANPFNNLPVSHKQFFAIAFNAFQSQPATSGESPVIWEFTMRDFVWKRGRKQGGKHAGEDLSGNPFYDWCLKDTYGQQRKYQNLPSATAILTTDSLLPNLDGGRGGNGSRNGNGSNNISSARKTQRCGGMAVDMQFRSPISGNCGFAMGSSESGIGIVPGTGSYIMADGSSLPIPNGIGAADLQAQQSQAEQVDLGSGSALSEQIRQRAEQVRQQAESQRSQARINVQASCPPNMGAANTAAATTVSPTTNVVTSQCPPAPADYL